MSHAGAEIPLREKTQAFFPCGYQRALSLTSWAAPQSTLGGQGNPFPLQHLCQQLDKFLESVVFEVSVSPSPTTPPPPPTSPAGPALQGDFCRKWVSKAEVGLQAHVKSLPFNASLQLQEQTNPNKKRATHEVMVWLPQGAEPISSSHDWLLSTGLIWAAGNGPYQLGAETMNRLDHEA